LFLLLRCKSKNKLIIEITTKDQKWIEVVKKLPYVKDVEVVGLKIKVKVESIEINKNMLLQNALEHKVNIIKFEMSNDTLEEIFLKLVVQK
ncbi:ATP-binding protein DrrA1-3 family domain-containing protein, partial [Bacillus sp. B-TM1]